MIYIKIKLNKDILSDGTFEEIFPEQADIPYGQKYDTITRHISEILWGDDLNKFSNRDFTDNMEEARKVYAYLEEKYGRVFYFHTGGL